MTFTHIFISIPFKKSRTDRSVSVVYFTEYEKLTFLPSLHTRSWEEEDNGCLRDRELGQAADTRPDPSVSPRPLPVSPLSVGVHSAESRAGTERMSLESVAGLSAHKRGFSLLQLRCRPSGERRGWRDSSRRSMARCPPSSSSGRPWRTRTPTPRCSGTWASRPEP